MAVTAMWVAWSVAVLVGTQMAMLIFAKQATEMAPLPLLLALVQFIVSALLSAAASARSGRGGAPWMPRSLIQIVSSLSAVWTAGFVLFNAAATIMSPGIVQLVRCVEPLASVIFGFASGKTYSLEILATLVPICGGVLLASFKGGMDGLPPLTGVGLAMLSNACFCLRPIYQHKLQKHPDHNALDDIGVFFNVTVVAVVLLPPCVWLFEGSILGPELRKLGANGQMGSFVTGVVGSSIFFFLYQFTQLQVMSQLTPLEFSILTPIVKAFAIVCCALYFGDDFGVQSAIGVAISLWGGYIFTVAKGRAETASVAKHAMDGSSSSTFDEPASVSKGGVQRRVASK